MSIVSQPQPNSPSVLTTADLARFVDQLKGVDLNAPDATDETNRANTPDQARAKAKSRPSAAPSPLERRLLRLLHNA